jgi:hypothetical protein
MNTERDFDLLANAWMAEGPDELPDRIFESAMDEVHGLPPGRRARRARRVLFGFPAHGVRGVGVLRFGVAVASVVAVAGLGVLALAVIVGGRPSVIVHPTGSPPGSPQASPRPSVSPRPSPTPRPQVPLTERFVSAVNRYSISYPAGWTIKPATKAFAYGSSLTLADPTVDVLRAPDGRTRLYITSMAIPRGVTELTWHLTQEQLQPDGPTVCEPGAGAGGQEDRHLAVTVGGVRGDAGPSCQSIQYVTPITGRRGYEFLLYPTPVGTGSEEEKSDRDLFVAILRSVELDP